MSTETAAQWILMKNIKPNASLQDHFKGFSISEAIHYELGDEIKGYRVNKILINDNKIEIWLSKNGKDIITHYPTNNIKYSWSSLKNSAPVPW
ncbi:MAG: hypothetical protein ACLQG5_04000 [Methanobacterium sp.]|jgi:hypothetical protein